MEIAPLALVVILGYGLLIAVSLTAWTAVTYGREETDDESRPQKRKGPLISQDHGRPKRKVSNDEVRGARSRRARDGSDPFRGGSDPSSGDRKPVPPASAGEGAAAGESATIAWKPEPGARRSDSSEDAEEDAFERFLNSRPEDFDIR